MDVDMNAAVSDEDTLVADPTWQYQQLNSNHKRQKISSPMATGPPPTALDHTYTPFTHSTIECSPSVASLETPLFPLAKWVLIAMVLVLPSRASGLERSLQLQFGWLGLIIMRTAVRVLIVGNKSFQSHSSASSTPSASVAAANPPSLSLRLIQSRILSMADGSRGARGNAAGRCHSQPCKQTWQS